MREQKLYKWTKKEIVRSLPTEITNNYNFNNIMKSVIQEYFLIETKKGYYKLDKAKIKHFNEIECDDMEYHTKCLTMGIPYIPYNWSYWFDDIGNKFIGKKVNVPIEISLKYQIPNVIHGMKGFNYEC